METPTLTERVARLEEITGMKPFDVDYGVVGDEEYRGAQKEFNRVMSERIVHDGINQRDTSEVASTYEEIMHRVQSCTDRVCATAGKIENIGDRIFGTRPDGEGSGLAKAVPSPQGTFEHALLALDWLDESLIRLQRATLRIERV